MRKMAGEIARSPVLSAFAIQVRFLRGRFYVERPTPAGVESWGRITPVEDGLLLEVERRSWKEVATGSPQKLIGVIAGDTKGTFHGLGSLDQSLRKAGLGLTRLPVKPKDNQFVHADTGEGCSVQEALFLPDFGHVEPALRRYLGSLAAYKKNRFPELPADLRARIAREWRRCFEEWAYPT
jgi:hypothetical protein